MPPPAKKEKLAISSRVIFLVRHGHYGIRDLTELGKEQARQTGTALKIMMGRGDINPNCLRIVGSTMTRAKQTAEIICSCVEVQHTLDTELIEGDPKLPHTADRFNRVYSKYLVRLKVKQLKQQCWCALAT